MDTEGKPEKHPELARLEALEDHCRRRNERARRRLEGAQEEAKEAGLAHTRALHSLFLWREANPDPQRSLFDG